MALAHALKVSYVLAVASLCDRWKVWLPNQLPAFEALSTSDLRRLKK